MTERSAIILPAIDDRLAKLRGIDHYASNPLLVGMLEIAVPIEIADMKDSGGVTQEHFDWLNNVYMKECGCHGDDLMFGSGKPGVAACYFSQLVRALAIMSFIPGGVEFASMKFGA